MRARRALVGLFAAVGTWLAVSASLSAMSPTVIMFYGSPLAHPVYLVVRGGGDMDADAVYWGADTAAVRPEQLGDRPFIRMAFFWDVGERPITDATLAGLDPVNANQHGRLYLPTDHARASAVATALPRVLEGRMALQPIPNDAAAFRYGNWLGPADIARLQAAGIPKTLLPMPAQ
jgi:hypothetical protein